MRRHSDEDEQGCKLSFWFFLPHLLRESWLFCWLQTFKMVSCSLWAFLLPPAQRVALLGSKKTGWAWHQNGTDQIRLVSWLKERTSQHLFFLPDLHPSISWPSFLSTSALPSSVPSSAPSGSIGYLGRDGISVLLLSLDLRRTVNLSLSQQASDCTCTNTWSLQL